MLSPFWKVFQISPSLHAVDSAIVVIFVVEIAGVVAAGDDIV